MTPCRPLALAVALALMGAAGAVGCVESRAAVPAGGGSDSGSSVKDGSLNPTMDGAERDALEILGHQSVQMTMRYSHLTPDAFKDDYARLGTQVAVGEATVIELNRSSG